MAQLQHKKPVALYVPLELVETFDPLTALIASDLIYWIYNKGKRWTTYQEWADWFGVSYDAVKARKNNLSKIFIIGRTRRVIDGGLKVRGANIYSLKAEYRHLVNIFEPIETRKIKSAIFPLDYITISTTISGKANINLAWFLCRLSSIFHYNKHTFLNFKSRGVMSKMTETERRTLDRYLEIAERAKLLKVLNENGFRIKLTETGQQLLLNPFAVIDRSRQKKIDDARLAGLAALCEETMPYEHVLMWADELAEREIGISLGEYVAKRDGLVDEQAGYDQLYSNCEY